MLRVNEHAAAIVEKNLLHQIARSRDTSEDGYGEIEVAQPQSTRQFLGDTAHDGEVHGVATVGESGAGGRNDAAEKPSAACDANRYMADQAVEQSDSLVLQMAPFGQDAFRSEVNGFAKCGGRHAFGSAVEQLGAEVGFELMNALAQARLRDVEQLGRFSKAASFDCCYEAFQLTQIHCGLRSISRA